MHHVIEHITTGTELSLVQASLVALGHSYVIIDGKRLEYNSSTISTSATRLSRSSGRVRPA